jgi:hypothetical protein
MNNNSSGQILPFSVSNTRHYLLLFLLWPFLAFITAIINFSQKEAKKVVYFFLIYYGLTLVINGDSYIDAMGYAMKLKSTALLPFSDFFKIVGGIYATDTSVDIIEPLVSFIVSRVTSFHGIYFAIWAAIFGYFYLNSINLLYNRFNKSHGWDASIILIFFILVLPITKVTGVRMWTAAWIFFYGAYHVILNRDPKYLIIALSSSLVHWSFMSANAILLIYFFAGNRNLIYSVILIVSFIVPQLITPLFQGISMKLGGALQQRFEGYSNEEYIQQIQQSNENANWFMSLSDSLIFYFLIFAIAFIKLRFGFFMKEKHEKNLFSFLLLFLAFVNFGNGIPSFGSRFQIVFFLLATLYIFLFTLKLPVNKINLLTLIGIFPMALNIALTLRLGSESINAWIFTPLFGLPLLAPGLSLAEFLF